MNYVFKAQKHLNRWHNLRPVLEEQKKKVYPLTPTQNSFAFFEQEPENIKTLKMIFNKRSKLTVKKRSNSTTSKVNSNSNLRQQRNTVKKQQTGLFNKTVTDSKSHKVGQIKKQIEELRTKYNKAQGLNLKLKKDISTFKYKILETNDIAKNMEIRLLNLKTLLHNKERENNKVNDLYEIERTKNKNARKAIKYLMKNNVIV